MVIPFTILSIVVICMYIVSNETKCITRLISLSTWPVGWLCALLHSDVYDRLYTLEAGMVKLEWSGPQTRGARAIAVVIQEIGPAISRSHTDY